MHACLQIRDSIKSLFPDRDCYTLVRPMHDERALNHLDSLDPSQLRPEFSEVCTAAADTHGVWLVDLCRAAHVDAMQLVGTWGQGR